MLIASTALGQTAPEDCSLIGGRRKGHPGHTVNPEVHLGQAIQDSHARIIALVGRSNGGTELCDGMDLEIYHPNGQDGKMHIYGAGISMIVSRNGKVQRIRGDKR